MRHTHAVGTSLFSGSAVAPRMPGGVAAVVAGLGAMVGAGVFAVLAPAARAAGVWLPLALAIAATVAYCSAISETRLALHHRGRGGAYVYGRRRLGEGWGLAAGWAFAVGAVAACAAVALTFGAYVWPSQPRAGALVILAVVVVLRWSGTRAPVRAAALACAAVLAVLAAVVVLSWSGDAAEWARVAEAARWHGLSAVLSAAGLLFFAFAGWTRISGSRVGAGEREIGWALGTALGGYVAVAVTAVAVLGPRALARSATPVLDVAAAGGASATVESAVAAGAALACVGVLGPVVAAAAHMVAVLAADGHVPRWLGGGARPLGVPERALVAVGAAAAAAVAVVDLDLRTAAGMSAFGILVYYAVANASALRLGPTENRPWLAMPVVGLVGCTVLALCLPSKAVVCGMAAVGAGVAVFVVRRWRRRRASARA
ncbi:APC family permease [Thermobifida halotolerans]|uniref:APC family permease n=1 Tax=Thermobifida halotolerans TaxID=483545 RepID=A0AA97M4P2_9ACTN|nr:APC family permease [Thermobifida halotolerans]